VVGVTVTDDSVLEMIEKREQAPRLPVMVLLESDVKDLADAHVRVLEQRATGTFNLEGPREVAIIELAEAVCKAIPGNAGIVRTEARGGDYQGRVVSRARAQNVLGWTPETSFEDGFQRTLDWFVAKWSEQLTAAVS